MKLDSIAKGIIRNRIIVLGLITVITLLSLYSIRRLTVYNGVDIWIDRSAREFNDYKEFADDFGNDETIILLFHSDSLFDNANLRLNRIITDSLLNIEGVESALSLSTIKIPSSNLFGPRMVQLLPASTTNPARLKDKVLGYKSLRDLMVSGDGLTTSFVIIPDSLANRTQLLNSVRITAERCLKGSGEYVIVGVVPIKEEVNRLSAAESKFFLIIGVILIVLFNFILFRRVKEAFMPLIVALITISWTLGLMAMLGITLNVVLVVLPLVLLIIGIAYSIHLLNGFLRYTKEGMARGEAVTASFTRVFRNSFFSALTTAVGLFAFTLSDIAPIVNFGIFAGIGVLIAFFLTFTFLPAIYSCVDIKPGHRSVLNRTLADPGKITDLITGNKKLIIGISSLFLVISVAGISRLKVNTDQIEYFMSDNPVRVESETAGRWLNGIMPLEMVLTLDSNIFESPDLYLQDLVKLEESLGQIEEVKSWTSPIMFLKDFGLLKRDTSGNYISAYMPKGEPSEMLQHLISRDGRRVRITLRTSWLNDTKVLDLISEIERVGQDILTGSNVGMHFTGSAVIFAHLSSRLVKSQIRSVLFSFMIIFGLFLLIFRSSKVAVVSMLPNILPVAFTLGLMGFLKVPLDVATVLIASVSFGIAVDDTIHFVGTFQNSVKEGGRIEALREAYAVVAKPLIATSLLIMAGFLIMGFSSYKPIIYLGLFISSNILMALIYDLILLPVILVSINTGKNNSGNRLVQ